MRLIRWSVSHPAAILSLYVGLIALSIPLLLYVIPVRLTPAIPNVLISVSTEVMGMPAEQVEQLLSTPLERGLVQVSGVLSVRSVSMHGMSIVTLEFPYHYDMRRAAAEVTATTQALSTSLDLQGWHPQGPLVTQVDPLNIPVLRLAARAPNWDPAALQDLLDTTLTARLRQLPGVDAVYTFGGKPNQSSVMVDRDRLAGLGLSLLDVLQALERSTRAQPAGSLQSITDNTQIVRLAGLPLKLSDLASIVIGRQKGRPVLLSEVAHVGGVMEEDAPVYRCNGREAVEVNVVQRPDASSPRTIAAVRGALAELVQSHPGLELEVAYDNAHFVEIVGRNVWIELVVAILLTGCVVYLFLGDFRGTLIALATVPTSLAGAVVLLAPLGLSLNSSTLVGLLLAIGRLVDDTIIDLHSVQRHRAMGKDARSAAVDGCSEVRRAVIAATLVICLAMLPLTFAGGLTQDMFVGIVWPFLLSLASSLVVALTLTPLLAAWAYTGAPVRPPASPMQRLLDRLEGRYRVLLAQALKVPGVVLSAAFGLCYLAWMLVPLIGSEMMPLSDTGQIYCVLEARPGTTTAETARLARSLEEILKRQPEIVRVSTEVGAARGGAVSTGYGLGGANLATMMITLTDKDARRRTIWDICDEVWQEAVHTIPQIRRLSLKEMGSDVMASAMAPIELVIHGPDLDRVAWLADQTRQLAEGMSGLQQVSTAWALQQGAWTLHVDVPSAERIGLCPTEVAEQVFLGLEGRETSARLADGSSVMLAYRLNQRRTLRDVEEAPIWGSTGERVPLRRLATLERGLAPDMIMHDNLQRCNSVMGSYRNGGPGSMQLSMDLLMASRMQLPYPPGYDIEQRGDMTQMMDAFSRLLWGLGLAIALIYLALVVQFGSLTTPLAIMAAIPLELPGVLVALVLAHQTFSTVSLLGILVLNGMDVTASILVLDAVLARRVAGASLREALLEGAPTRLRPVLMTVFVTLVVMVPLAFFPRTGMDAYTPLATVVVGGLTMSTLLTLGVVPILYSVLADRSDRVQPIG